MEYSPIFDQMLQVIENNPKHYSPEQHRAINRMRSCRTIDMGGRVAYCPSCKTHTILYNPCNKRGCPNCYEKNQIIWKNKLQEKILPIGHYHLIFSAPKEITSIWVQKKKLIGDLFFYSVQQAFKHLQEETGIMLGITMVFQTHGKGLSYKPHLHCIVTSGGLFKNRKWVEIQSLPYKKLLETVRQEFIRRIRKKINRKELIDMIEKSDDRDWSVYPVIHRDGGKGIVRYLSHAVCGVVIDMNQKFSIDHEQGTIRFQEYHGNEVVWTTLRKEVFTDRYLHHIPPNHAVTIRNYGLYSNRHVNELEKVRNVLMPSIPKNNQAETDGTAAADRCALCDTPLEIKERFSPGEIPIVLGAMLFCTSRDPPVHGEYIIIQ